MQTLGFGEAEENEGWFQGVVVEAVVVSREK